MADGVHVTTNLPDFLRQMREFSFDMQKNIVRSGVRAAGVIFKKRANELAPVSKTYRKKHISGTLKRNIILARAKRQTPGEEHQFITVRGRATPKKGDPLAFRFLPFYWRWVEEGHRIVKRGAAISGGRRTKTLKRARFDASGGGRTKPAWFLRRAFQSAGGAALEAFNKRIEDRINKENAKR